MDHQDDAAPQLLSEAVSRETADSKILWSARASPWAYARNRLKIFQRKIERRGKGTSVTEVGFIGLYDFAEAEAALKKMMDLNEKRFEKIG